MCALPQALQALAWQAVSIWQGQPKSWPSGYGCLGNKTSAAPPSGQSPILHYKENVGRRAPPTVYAPDCGCNQLLQAPTTVFRATKNSILELPKSYKILPSTVLTNRAVLSKRRRVVVKLQMVPLEEAAQNPPTTCFGLTSDVIPDMGKQLLFSMGSLFTILLGTIIFLSKQTGVVVSVHRNA